MIDEIFWLCISLILTIFFIYKPVKLHIKKKLDNYIDNVQSLVNEAKKSHFEAKTYLRNLEKDLATQKKLNQKKILENVKMRNILTLKNQIELQEEVDKQIADAKIQRKIKEDNIVQNITSQFIYQIIRNINLNLDDQLNYKFIKQSLKKIDKVK